MRPLLVLALLCAAVAAAKGPLDAHDSKEEANAAFAGVAKLLTQQQLKGGRPLQPLFKAWKEKFGQTYAPDEDVRRYANFVKSVEKIVSINKSRRSKHWAGLNRFAAMTRAEFRAETVMTSKPPPAKASPKGLKAALKAASTGVDWRAAGYVTPVVNQGGCGSCWAFAGAAALESAVLVHLGKTYSEFPIKVSEQQLVDCVHCTDCNAGTPWGSEGCNGGYSHETFMYAASQFMTSGGRYPYTKATCGATGTCYVWSPSTCQTATIAGTPASEQVKISGKGVGPDDWDAVNWTGSKSESQVKAAISQQPIMISIYASSSDLQYYSGGVITNSACGQGKYTDHAVLAVGWSTGGPDGNYFLVKNSWGAGWGEQGYFRIGMRGDGTNGYCNIYMFSSFWPANPTSPAFIDNQCDTSGAYTCGTGEGECNCPSPTTACVDGQCQLPTCSGTSYTCDSTCTCDPNSAANICDGGKCKSTCVLGAQCTSSCLCQAPMTCQGGTTKYCKLPTCDVNLDTYACGTDCSCPTTGKTSCDPADQLCKDTCAVGAACDGSCMCSGKYECRDNKCQLLLCPASGTYTCNSTCMCDPTGPKTICDGGKCKSACSLGDSCGSTTSACLCQSPNMCSNKVCKQATCPTTTTATYTCGTTSGTCACASTKSCDPADKRCKSTCALNQSCSGCLCASPNVCVNGVCKLPMCDAQQTLKCGTTSGKCTCDPAGSTPICGTDGNCKAKCAIGDSCSSCSCQLPNTCQNGVCQQGRCSSTSYTCGVGDGKCLCSSNQTCTGSPAKCKATCSVNSKCTASCVCPSPYSCVKQGSYTYCK